MSASPSRGNLFAERLTDEDAWRLPSPRAEAAACLRVALSNGGVEHMREVIAVSEGERAELLAWAAEEPTLTSRILGAVSYREEVLAEFDELVAAENLASGNTRPHADGHLRKSKRTRSSSLGVTEGTGSYGFAKPAFTSSSVGRPKNAPTLTRNLFLFRSSS